MKNHLIERFLKQVKRRLNLIAGLRVFCWMIAGAGILLLLHAGYYRIQGEKVPWNTAFVLIGLAGVFGLVRWLLLRVNPKVAARAADDQLHLKDALSSAFDFAEQGKDEAVHALQQKQTEEALQSRDVKEIPLKYPRSVLLGGSCLCIVSLWMGFLAPSQAVQDRQAKETLTSERTEEIRQEMERVIEEITKNLDEEEKEVLKPDMLKQWVKDLKPTKDQKEALRQLAKFEQKLSKAIAGLDAKKDEESLKRAAVELSKSDQAAARKLGKHLERKEFDQAAQELKNAAMKPGEHKPDKNNQKGRKLSKQELKKLREMTKRMANAARKNHQGKFRQGKPMQGKQGKAPRKMARGRDMGKGKPMDQMLEDLDDAAAELEEMEENGEQGNEDMQMAQDDLNEKLRGMRNRLKRLNAKNKARRKLAGLRAGLSKAQNYALGKGSAQGGQNMFAQLPGGNQAGKGTDQTRRKNGEELKDNKNFAQLQGQKGKGPSMTAVEDADSGSGVSKRSTAKRERDFRRQMESFVHRDDVPEDVKMGVKEYFEKVHQSVESNQ